MAKIKKMCLGIVSMGQKVMGQSGLLPLTANVAQAAKEFARKNVHQRACCENGESSKLLTVRRFKV